MQEEVGEEEEKEEEQEVQDVGGEAEGGQGRRCKNLNPSSARSLLLFQRRPLLPLLRSIRRKTKLLRPRSSLTPRSSTTLVLSTPFTPHPESSSSLLLSSLELRDTQV